jgi:hypothetical protein
MLDQIRHEKSPRPTGPDRRVVSSRWMCAGNRAKTRSFAVS